jgi:bacterioferritin (cytochrome b1)
LEAGTYDKRAANCKGDLTGDWQESAGGSRLAREQFGKEQTMDDLTDVNLMFGLTKTADEISPIEKLLNEFEAHEAKEEKTLDEYRKALGDMRDPATRFVMQLIISDEEKHRAVTHALAATLKGSLNWTKPAASLEGAADEPEINRKLSAVTEDFIDLEKAGIKEYKLLLKESSGYYHDLFKILIEAMIRDSEKHIEMLDFLSRRLKAA